MFCFDSERVENSGQIILCEGGNSCLEEFFSEMDWWEAGNVTKVQSDGFQTNEVPAVSLASPDWNARPRPLGSEVSQHRRLETTQLHINCLTGLQKDQRQVEPGLPPAAAAVLAGLGGELC